MDRFPTNEKCKNYLMEMKWKDGFSCDKCRCKNYWEKKGNPYVRVCKSCRHINSITANTLSHKVKSPLAQSFFYPLRDVRHNKELSFHCNGRENLVPTKRPIGCSCPKQERPCPAAGPIHWKGFVKWTGY